MRARMHQLLDARNTDTHNLASGQAKLQRARARERERESSERGNRGPRTVSDFNLKG